MPKSTFFNLPEDKRARITECALDEFAARSYHRASLSRLVARAGIAKGSVYQYFDDKLDLYRWLITEEVPRRKAAHMLGQSEAAPPMGSLRGFLRFAVLSGVRFMLADPRLTQLGSAIVTPTDDPELRALYAEAVAIGHERFTQVLTGMVEAGQLRGDVDPSLIARVIASVLGIGLRDIVLGQLGVDVFELTRDPSIAERLTDADLERLVDDILSVLMDGLRPGGDGLG